MTRLIAAFIRHGEYHQLPNTPSAHQPFALNEVGQQQSRQAALAMSRFIRDNNWQLIEQVDSSNLLRAWQTAQIYIEQLSHLFEKKPELQSFESLAERGLGSAANLTTQQIEAIFQDDPRFEALKPNWKSDSYFCLPLQGAESLMMAGQRVAEHLQKQMSLIPRLEKDQVKLFVGHGAAFRHAAYKLGIIEFDDIAKLSMFHAQPIYIEYLPDSGWKHIAGEWKIRGNHSEYRD